MVSDTPLSAGVPKQYQFRFFVCRSPAHLGVLTNRAAKRPPVALPCQSGSMHPRIPDLSVGSAAAFAKQNDVCVERRNDSTAKAMCVSEDLRVTTKSCFGCDARVATG